MKTSIKTFVMSLILCLVLGLNFFVATGAELWLGTDWNIVAYILSLPVDLLIVLGVNSMLDETMKA